MSDVTVHSFLREAAVGNRHPVTLTAEVLKEAVELGLVLVSFVLTPAGHAVLQELNQQSAKAKEPK